MASFPGQPGYAGSSKIIRHGVPAQAPSTPLALCYSQNSAVQCGLDPATQISSTLSFIVQCAWFQAACNPHTCHGCQCSAVLHLLLYVVKLQIIKAHPNWPVFADVFEHPPPRLASRCPIWSHMTSVDKIMRWREDWSLASVVNHTFCY